MLPIIYIGLPVAPGAGKLFKHYVLYNVRSMSLSICNLVFSFRCFFIHLSLATAAFYGSLLLLPFICFPLNLVHCKTLHIIISLLDSCFTIISLSVSLCISLPYYLSLLSLYLCPSLFLFLSLSLSLKLMYFIFYTLTNSHTRSAYFHLILLSFNYSLLACILLNFILYILLAYFPQTSLLLFQYYPLSLSPSPVSFQSLLNCP